MNIKYEFATETVEIEVTAEWAEVIAEYDRLEYNNNHKETRRHEYYSYGTESYWMADSDLDPLEIKIREENKLATKGKADMMLATLTDAQEKLVYKRYCLNMSVNDIADEEGVDHSTISHRLERIRKKLKKFL